MAITQAGLRSDLAAVFTDLASSGLIQTATFYAANKRAAITSAVTLLAPILMAVMLAHLLDSHAKIKILLITLASLGVVAAFQSADQFFIENGTNQAPIVGLVGGSNYVKVLQTVANESYPGDYSQGEAIIVTNIAGARTLTYLQ